VFLSYDFGIRIVYSIRGGIFAHFRARTGRIVRYRRLRTREGRTSVRPTGAGGYAATTNRVCGRRASATVASVAVAGPKPIGFARAVAVRGNPAGVAPAHPSRKPAYGGTRKPVSPSSKHEKAHAAFSNDEVA